MAIKSKGKTRSRQPARAPRREPVVVKRPLFLRRWVQLIGAALGGAAIVLLTFWVVDGLRQDRAQSLARRQAATKLAAATRWKTTVEGAVEKAGTLGSGSQPPSMLPQVSTALTKLEKGASPKGTVDDMKVAATSATQAATTITKFDLTGTITEKGFTAQEALAFTDSRDGLAASLRLYAQAATMAESAAEATGSARVVLAKSATALMTEATTELQTAWNSYEQALFAGGITQGPQGTSGLPGATGSAP